MQSMEYNKIEENAQKIKLAIPKQKRDYNLGFKIEQKTFVPKTEGKKVKTVTLTTSETQQEQQESFNLSSKKLAKTFDKNIQSGYQTKTNYVVKEVPKVDNSEDKTVPVKSDTINKFKETFRSGYQEKNTSNLVSDKRITMGVLQPTLIKNQGCQGANAYECGYSGYIKESLKNKI